MPMFRKKPVVIEAVQFIPNKEDPAFAAEVTSGKVWYKNDKMYIHTLEGIMEASPYDWIVRGIKGELYPCKPDIFDETYEPANNWSDWFRRYLND